MSVVVVRTHYFDNELLEMANDLAKKGRRVVFVADESAGSVVVPDAFQKISLTAETVRNLGLATPPRLGWQCGDYALYLARQAAPDASHYWLIEPDVQINQRHAGAFLDFFEARPEVDFLSCYFKVASAKWFWQPAMARFTTPVYHSLFPLVRASSRALDVMLERRVAMSATFTTERLQDDPYSWPNDEAFSSTICKDAGLNCCDINSFGQTFYEDKTFSYVRPHSRRYLKSRPVDGKIYHPVLSGDRFMEKARSQLGIRKNRGVPRAYALFGPAFMQELRMECGDHAAREFERDVSGAIAELPHGKIRALIEIRMYRLLQPLLLRAGIVGQG